MHRQTPHTHAQTVTNTYISKFMHKVKPTKKKVRINNVKTFEKNINSLSKCLRPFPNTSLPLVVFSYFSLAFEIQMKCIFRPQGDSCASFQSTPLKNWRQIERIKWKRNLLFVAVFFFFGGKYANAKKI